MNKMPTKHLLNKSLGTIVNQIPVHETIKTLQINHTSATFQTKIWACQKAFSWQGK